MGRCESECGSVRASERGLYRLFTELTGIFMRKKLFCPIGPDSCTVFGRRERELPAVGEWKSGSYWELKKVRVWEDIGRVEAVVRAGRKG